MNHFRALLGPIVVIVIWAVVAKLQFFDPFLLPHPEVVFLELISLIQSGTMTYDIIATSLRATSAFAIAISLGIPLGLFLGNTEKLYRSIEIVIDFFRSTPATAIFPLFLLIFGVGDFAKIAVAAFGALLTIIFNTAYGVMNSRKPRLLAAKVMGASAWQRFRLIVFWESLPQTFVGLRSGVSLALVIIVVAEMFIGTNVGLGRRIVDSQITYSIPTMYAAIFVSGLLGYFLNAFLLFLEHRFAHWSGK